MFSNNFHFNSQSFIVITNLSHVNCEKVRKYNEQLILEKHFLLKITFISKRPIDLLVPIGFLIRDSNLLRPHLDELINFWSFGARSSSWTDF